MDDDYMLLEPVRSILPHYGGIFQEVWQNRNRLREEGFDWWLISLERTWALLRSIDSPGWFERHRPFPVDSRAVIRLLSNFEGKPSEAAPMWRTLYGNFVGFSD